MTYNDIISIAKKLDKETKARIDKEIAERIKILEDGEVDEQSIDEVEECLYTAFVLQEYLNGKYELLEEERLELLSEMEELYNTYVDLLARAKIEEKLSKKKRMALELMQIREQLFGHKEHMKEIKQEMQETKNKSGLLDELTSKDNMKQIVKENKELIKKNEELNKNNSELRNSVEERRNSEERANIVGTQRNSEERGNLQGRPPTLVEMGDGVNILVNTTEGNPISKDKEIKNQDGFNPLH